MKIVVYIVSFFILISCQKESKVQKSQQNKDLIYFEPIGAFNKDERDFFKSKLKPTKVEAQYVNGYVIASVYIVQNECVALIPDITYRNDSIILLNKYEPDEAMCTGLEMVRLNYFIRNRENKKYKFGYKGVNSVLSSPY